MLADIRRRFLYLPVRGRLGLLAALAVVPLAAATTMWALTAPAADTVDAHLQRSHLAGRAELRVGLLDDAPPAGYALRTGGAGATAADDRTGFDVELARHLAGYLGFAGDAVRFVGTRAEDRAADLDGGRVDLVVATQPMPQPAAGAAGIVGPYLAGRPAVLVPAGAAAPRPVTLDQLDQLGKRLCSTGGAVTEAAVRAGQLHGFTGLGDGGQCVAGLLGGAYDAFLLDDISLAGYRARHPDRLALVEVAAEHTATYGIAVPAGDQALRRLVGGFLWDSYERGEHGAWQRAWDGTLGQVLGERRQPRPDAYPRLRERGERPRGAVHVQARS